jgi:hypothetical protein
VVPELDLTPCGPGGARAEPAPAWWAGRMYLTLGALLLLALAGHLVSVRLHPYRRCRRCQGLGKHFGRVFGFAHRPCRWCSGLGRKPRLGARLP